MAQQAAHRGPALIRDTEHPTTCCTRLQVSSGNVAEGGLGGMKGTKKGVPRTKEKQENPFTTNYDGVVS